MPAEKRCYYEVLGVERGSSGEEIRKAYRREALKHHPDRNPGDAQAEARFKEVNEAYQVLSDEEKRRIYDRFGHAGLQGGVGGGDGGMGGFGDMFSQMQDLFAEMFSTDFGGGRQARRGANVRVQARISLAEAVHGCKKEVSVQTPAACDECSGTGAATGTRPETCGVCRGTGQVSSARGFVMFTAPCSRCAGRGSVIRTPCKTCKGEGVVAKSRRVLVTFPPGVDTGTRLRVTGQGMSGPSGAGDLYVDVDVEEDPRFERDGTELITRVSIPFAKAALGTELEVPCLAPPGDGAEAPAISITVPPGTQPGHVFTVKGKGVPRLDGRGRGALHVVVQIEVPTELTPRARELLQELSAELDRETPAASRKRAAK
jgi:molecular chaperone DnaJ